MAYLLQIQYAGKPTSVTRYERKNAVMKVYRALKPSVGKGEIWRVVVLESAMPNQLLASCGTIRAA